MQHYWQTYWAFDAFTRDDGRWKVGLTWSVASLAIAAVLASTLGTATMVVFVLTSMAGYWAMMIALYRQAERHRRAWDTYVVGLPAPPDPQDQFVPFPPA